MAACTLLAEDNECLRINAEAVMLCALPSPTIAISNCFCFDGI